MFTSLSTSNVTVRVIVPSFAFVDCMYSILSTPFICCSSGVATDCSIVTASAPVKLVWIWICGGMIAGYWAIGSPVIATSPRTTVTMAITIATMGRSTKKRDIVLELARARGGRGVAGGVGRFGLHRHARLHELEPRDDDPFAGLQPRPDHPQLADPL